MHELPAHVTMFPCEVQPAGVRRLDTTFTGRPFWPLDPRPEELDIEDIAVALFSRLSLRRSLQAVLFRGRAFRSDDARRAPEWIQ